MLLVQVVANKRRVGMVPPSINTWQFVGFKITAIACIGNDVWRCIEPPYHIQTVPSWYATSQTGQYMLALQTLSTNIKPYPSFFGSVLCILVSQSFLLKPLNIFMLNFCISFF